MLGRVALVMKPVLEVTSHGLPPVLLESKGLWPAAPQGSGSLLPQSKGETGALCPSSLAGVVLFIAEFCF